MTEQNNEEFTSFDLSELSFEEEDENSNKQNQAYYETPNTGVLKQLESELELTKKQLVALESKMNQDKSNWVEDVFKEFADVDPSLKGFIYKMIEGYDKATVKERTSLFQQIEKAKQDIEKVNQGLEKTNKWVNSLETDEKFRRLVKRSLENSFKKQTITEKAIDSAISTHTERLSKDPAYRLKVDDVAKAPHLKLTEKIALMGELIHQTFADKLTKTKKRKEGDPVLKSNKTVNEEAEKAKRHLEANKEKGEVVKLSSEQASEKTKQAIRKLMNS